MNPMTKPNILVADADPIQLGQTVSALAPAHFQIFTAVSRESAFSTAQIISIDLLLVDLGLAVEGLPSGLVDEIHDLPDRSDVPVIFTSPGQGPDVIRRQHEFGGAFHIKTPFDPTVMITLIERVLWMPHLIQSHVAKPHFSLNSPGPVPHYWPSASLSQVSQLLSQ